MNQVLISKTEPTTIYLVLHRFSGAIIDVTPFESDSDAQMFIDRMYNNPTLDYKNSFYIREVMIDESDLAAKFADLKSKFHDEVLVTATLRRDVEAFLGAENSYTLTAGTRVRIVMSSRFGDVGITPNLDTVGYHARVGGEGIEIDNELMPPRNPGTFEELFENVTFEEIK